MIQWILSKSGHEVPLSNGQVLASRYHPLNEAKHFLESRRAQLDDVECVFIVGAGNPFLVQELLRRGDLAAIVVVDQDPELISEVERRFRNDLVSWICPRSFSDGCSFLGYEKFFRLSSAVIVAPAAQFLDPAWVQSCVSFLKGHSVAGFYFQMGLRFPDLAQAALRVVPDGDQSFGKHKALELMRNRFTSDEVTSILSEIVR